MARRKQFQCLLVCVFLCWLLIIICKRSAEYAFTDGRWMALYGLVFFCVLVWTFISLDILRLSPADSHSTKTLLLQYLIISLLKTFGWLQYKRHLVNSKMIHTVQLRLLHTIIRQNENTLWGQKYNYRNIHSWEQFKKAVPLTTYSDYEPFIDMISKGEQNILTKDPVIFLATTSGTTGKNRIFPITAWFKSFAGKRIGCLMYYWLNRRFGLRMSRTLYLYYKARVKESECGLKIAPITYHMGRHIPFLVSPKAVYMLDSEQPALYIHALFGLVEREIGFLDGMMSTLVYSFWKVVENNWQQLCLDIENGSICSDLEIDENIKVDVSRHLIPCRQRGEELRKEFAKGFDNIALRVWPGLKMVRMLTSGGFAAHASVLRDTYMKGVPQISQIHAASEAFVGVNMSMQENFTYAMLPHLTVYEFISTEDCQMENPPTLKMEDLQLGSQYEVVVTTPCGLSRYRIGDVVKIVDFINQCPVYEFQHRMGQMLNLYWEKTPERVFYMAVETTVKSLEGMTLIDYTATEDLFLPENSCVHSVYKHYVLFIEIEAKTSHRSSEKADKEQHRARIIKLTEEEKFHFDETLCDIFELYHTFRDSGSIGPMRVIQVKPGTFLALKYRKVESTQNQQYKTPRVLRDSSQLQFLLQNKVE